MAERLDLNLARILCEVMETSSVSLTAKNLDTNVSSISLALNKLRKYYNNPLFFRRASGMEPSALALELYKIYQPALALLQQAEKDTLTLGKPAIPTKIRIACVSTLDLILMQNLLSDTFFTTDISWDISTHPHSDSERIERLRKMQVDIDIGNPLTKDSSLLCYPLFQCGAALVCRKDHPRIDDKVSAEQFKREGWLGYIPGYEQVGKELSLIQYHDDSAPYKSFRSSSGLNLLFMTAQSDNVCFIPEAYIPWACKTFDLKVVHCDFPADAHFNIGAYIHRTRVNDPFLKKIISFASHLA